MLTPRHIRGLIAGAMLLVLIGAPVHAQKDKTTEDGLPLLELDEAQRKKGNQPPPLTTAPNAVIVETSRLNFLISYPSRKRLLSDQAKDAIQSILKQSKTDHIVKVRALVSGRGDARVVEATILEELIKKRVHLPAISVIQVGYLAENDSQVVLEAWVHSKNELNPHGLAFISGQGAGIDEYRPNLLPILKETLDKVDAAVKAVAATRDSVARVTCFTSAMGDIRQMQKEADSRYPKAGIVFAQNQRASGPGFIECEAVARLSEGGLPEGVHNIEGLGSSSGYSSVGIIRAPRFAVTGLQLSFGLEERDARLAFERIDRTLGEVNSSTKHSIFASIYPLSSQAAKVIRAVREEFYTPKQPPASTLMIFAALPALDATFAFELVALRPESK